MQIMKSDLHPLIGIITRIVNISVESGIYLDPLETAMLRPLLKKIGLEL